MLFFSRSRVLTLLLTAAVVSLFAVPDRLIAQSATIEFRMVDQSMSVEQAQQSHPPPDSEILFAAADKRPYLVEKRVLLSSADMCDAQADYDQRTSEPIVKFRFTAAGTKIFAQLTQDNVGRPFAIVLNNEVLSAPVVREPILGGSGQISGKFTVVQANDLAIAIRAGATPKC